MALGDRALAIRDVLGTRAHDLVGDRHLPEHPHDYVPRFDVRERRDLRSSPWRRKPISSLPRGSATSRSRRSRRSSSSSCRRSTSRRTRRRQGASRSPLIGNRFVISGSSYPPDVLQGKTWQQIASALSDPSSPIAKQVLCGRQHADRGDLRAHRWEPTNVCTAPGVTGRRGVAAVRMSRPTWVAPVRLRDRDRGHGGAPSTSRSRTSPRRRCWRAPRQGVVNCERVTTSAQ